MKLHQSMFLAACVFMTPHMTFDVVFTLAMSALVIALATVFLE